MKSIYRAQVCLLRVMCVVLPRPQGLVIAGIADINRPAHKLSIRQSTALAATGKYKFYPDAVCKCRSNNPVDQEENNSLPLPIQHLYIVGRSSQNLPNFLAEMKNFNHNLKRSSPG